MEFTTKAILVKARGKIAKPENWCKSVAARNKDYGVCSISDPNACKWCATGAMASVMPRGFIRNFEHRYAYMKAGDLLDSFSMENSVMFYNDRKRTTHADILAVFDRAIEAAEQQEERKNGINR